MFQKTQVLCKFKVSMFTSKLANISRNGPVLLDEVKDFNCSTPDKELKILSVHMCAYVCICVHMCAYVCMVYNDSIMCAHDIKRTQARENRQSQQVETGPFPLTFL